MSTVNQNLLKHPRIASALRRQIVDGTFRPGDRLPTRVELERHFTASTVTVQKALDRLSRVMTLPTVAEAAALPAESDFDLIVVAQSMPGETDGSAFGASCSVGWCETASRRTRSPATPTVPPTILSN